MTFDPVGTDGAPGTGEAPPLLDIVKTSCPEPRAGEIVVCGQKNPDRYRLPEIRDLSGPPIDEDLPIGFDLSDSVRVGADVTQTVRSDGFVDRSVWVRVKIEF